MGREVIRASSIDFISASPLLNSQKQSRLVVLYGPTPPPQFYIYCYCRFNYCYVGLDLCYMTIDLSISPAGMFILK